MKQIIILLTFSVGLAIAGPIIHTSTNCSVFAVDTANIVESDSETCAVSGQDAESRASAVFSLEVLENGVQASWSGESAANWNSSGDNYVESSATTDIQAAFELVSSGHFRPGRARITAFGEIANLFNSSTYLDVVTPMLSFNCRPVGSMFPFEMPCSYQSPMSNHYEPFQLEAPVMLGTAIPIEVKAGAGAYGDVFDYANWNGFAGFNGHLSIQLFEEDGTTPVNVLPFESGAQLRSAAIVATPEPSTVWLGGLGLAAGVMARRSRRCD